MSNRENPELERKPEMKFDPDDGEFVFKVFNDGPQSGNNFETPKIGETPDISYDNAVDAGIIQECGD